MRTNRPGEKLGTMMIAIAAILAISIGGSAAIAQEDNLESSYYCGEILFDWCEEGCDDPNPDSPLLCQYIEDLWDHHNHDCWQTFGELDCDNEWLICAYVCAELLYHCDDPGSTEDCVFWISYAQKYGCGNCEQFPSMMNGGFEFERIRRNSVTFGLDRRMLASGSGKKWRTTPIASG